MAEALVISYSSGVPEVDPYWLRIEQVVTDRSVAANDAADLIDSIYRIDSCTGAVDLSADPAGSAGIVGPLAADLFDTDYCHRDDRPTTRVKIYRSHPSDDYVLRVMGAEASEPVVVDEQVSLLLPIKNATSVELTKPVVDGYSAAWRGAVSGAAGQVQPPEIRRDGHLLYWDGQVSGALEVGYRSVADLVTITWPETADSNLAELLAFYHGAAVLEQVSPNPADELTGGEQESACSGSGRSIIDELPGNCYEEASYYRVCQCSGRKDYSHTILRDVPCPQSLVDKDGRHLVERRDVNFYGDCRESDDVNTPEFYKERCCNEVPESLTLPLCRERTTDFSGVGISEEYRSNLEQQYPAPAFALSIVVVGPPAGEPCGKSTVTQQRGPANCCDGVPELAFDLDATPEILPHGSSVWIYVTGGVAPYIFTAADQDTYFANGKQLIVTAVPYVQLLAAATFCGSGAVRVEDGCSSASYELRSDLGQWVKIGEERWASGVVTSSFGTPCVAAGAGTEESYVFDPTYYEFASDAHIQLSVTTGGYRQDELVVGQQINDPDDICAYPPPLTCEKLMATAHPYTPNQCLGVSITWSVDPGESCDEGKYGVRGVVLCPNQVAKSRVFQMMSIHKVAYRWMC